MSETIHTLPFERAALFLDLDCAIPPEAEQEGESADACVPQLRRLAADLCGRLAVISARPLHDVDRLLGGSIACVAAVHGVQRRAATGEIYGLGEHPQFANAIAVLEALARAQFGLTVSPEAGRVAIDFSQAPGSEAAVIDTVERLAQATGLAACRMGDCAELAVPGADRAGAMRTFLTEAPFLGATPLFVGDCRDDARIIAEVAELNGATAAVGDDRPDEAALWLPGPDQMLAYLAQSLEAKAFTLREAAWPG